MAILKRRIVITTAGGAGVATGTGNVGVPASRLLAVDLDYTSQPATTDVTVTCNGVTLLSVANANADKRVYPRVAVQDTSGANIAGRGEEPPIVDGTVDIAVAQGDANAAGLAVILYLQQL